VLPYVPYARQDRVCNPGEALGIRVFTDQLNAQHYESVEIWDPHSDVTTALIRNVSVVHQCHFVKRVVDKLDKDGLLLVAPDKGALRKAEICSKLTGVPLIHAEKVRDPKTTEIIALNLSIPKEEFFSSKKDLLIIDDICDGGRTFIELSKELKRRF